MPSFAELGVPRRFASQHPQHVVDESRWVLWLLNWSDKATYCKHALFGQPVFLNEEKQSVQTTLGYAAQASYISRKLCIWSLVACQSYRTLELCWSESNQRCLSLSEKECMCQFLVPRTITNVDRPALISKMSPTEVATSQDASLPLQQS